MKNPLKSLGAWLGLLIAIPILYFSFTIPLMQVEVGTFALSSLLISPAVVIAGFLAGWRIHEKIKK